MKDKTTYEANEPVAAANDGKYRALFEQASDAIMVTDFNGNFLDANPSMCNMVGCTRAELLTMNISSFIQAEELKDRPIDFKGLAAGKQAFTERKMLHRDGRIINVEVNVKKFDGDKLLAIAHDVTERVSKYNIVYRSEENIKAIIENTDTSYILLDTKLNIVTFNKLSQEKSRLFLAKEFKEGNYFIDSIPDARKQIVDEALQHVLKGEYMEYEAEHKLADGSPVFIVIKEMPIKNVNGEVIGICISSVDITARKKAEQEKERTRYMLNERVKELTLLYQVAHIFEQEEKPEEELLKEVVSIIPAGWQYPESTAARITIGNLEYKTHNYAETSYVQRATFNTTDNRPGVIEVVYLEAKPEEAEGPFLKEERKLINMLADILRINLSRRHETEALKKSEANLQTIFKTTETAYILIDEKLQVISFNHQAEAFVEKEFKKKAAENTALLDYFPANQVTEIKGLIPDVMKGHSVAFESSYLQPDSSLNWYHAKLFPVPDLQGRALGFMLAVNDITGQKQFDEKINSQLQLLKEISFITSHELRHEYVKVYSIFNNLDTEGKISEQDKDLLTEGLKSFNKINSIIYKLNDKVTFGQITRFSNVEHVKNIAEYALLIDDDLITNALHSKVLDRHFQDEKITVVSTVDEALAYLKENDKAGKYLVFLDLNMPGKNGWDFLEAYRSFKIQSPVIILSSSIDPNDKDRAKEYDIVKNFVSKPLRREVIDEIMKGKFI